MSVIGTLLDSRQVIELDSSPWSEIVMPIMKEIIENSFWNVFCVYLLTYNLVNLD